jgi:hypothetical protein
MREGALKESFRMQREIKRAHRFVRSPYTRMSNNTASTNRLAIFSSAAVERHDLAIESIRVGPAGELHRFAPQVDDLDAPAEQIVHLRNPHVRSQPRRTRPLPLRISTQAAGVPPA